MVTFNGLQKWYRILNNSSNIVQYLTITHESSSKTDVKCILELKSQEGYFDMSRWYFMIFIIISSCSMSKGGSQSGETWHRLSGAAGGVQRWLACMQNISQRVFPWPALHTHTQIKVLDVFEPPLTVGWWPAGDPLVSSACSFWRSPLLHPAPTSPHRPVFGSWRGQCGSAWVSAVTLEGGGLWTSTRWGGTASLTLPDVSHQPGTLCPHDWASPTGWGWGLRSHRQSVGGALDRTNRLVHIFYLFY